MDLLYLVKKEMIRRKYSHRTIVTYSHCLRRFLNQCPKEPRKITKKDIREFLEKMTINRSASTLNVYLQAIKFALEEILNKRFFVKMPYSKVGKKLPVVLSKEEVRALIDSIENLKHRLMIKLMYSTGLRVAELCSLKVRDLELEKNYGWVRKGKGNKDRLFIVALGIKPELISRIEKNDLCSNSLLFRGRKGKVSSRTIQEIVRMAAKKCQFRKNVTPHTLRHSFATHLIENGYSVANVQGLLGHNSAETTMVYLHVTSPKMVNIRSPYDTLRK
jgi:integrase/recombinase XerD